MSYWTQAVIAADQDLLLRATACTAREGIANPQGWAYAFAWELSAQPGWVEAYASAIAGSVEMPGRDESVITDGMILAAVQALSAVHEWDGVS